MTPLTCIVNTLLRPLQLLKLPLLMPLCLLFSFLSPLLLNLSAISKITLAQF